MKNVLVLCDVDGVAAPMPWVKSLKPGVKFTELDFALDTVQWEWTFHKADPAVHFVLDEEVVFEFEDGLHPKKTQIKYSNEMIGRLRALGETPGVDFRWLTMWNERAVTHLNPVFQTAFPHLPTENRVSSMYDMFKWFAIQELLDKEGEKYDALVWVDDLHNTSFVTEPLERAGWMKSTFTRDYNNLPALVLQTDPRFGLDRVEMTRVGEFVTQHLS